MVDDRAALEGILFVLRTRCRRRDLPAELGCGSGHTAWRRLRELQEAGVWEQLHRRVLEESPRRRSWTGLVPASTRCPYAPKGSELTGANPTDRGKTGTKYYLLTDRNGLPLHALASRANTHDSTLRATAGDQSGGVRPPRVPRTTPPQARKAARGQGLSLAEMLELPPPPGHQGPHRPARHRGQKPSWPTPLGRGAHHSLGPAFQAPRHPLRPH